MGNDKIINGLMAASIAVLLIVIISIATCNPNKNGKQQIQDLTKANKELINQVNELEVQWKGAKLKSDSFEHRYISDTVQLAALQYSFDSLKQAISKIKIRTHENILAISRLSNHGTDSLFAINTARIRRLTGQ